MGFARRLSEKPGVFVLRGSGALEDRVKSHKVLDHIYFQQMARRFGNPVAAFPVIVYFSDKFIEYDIVQENIFVG
ncbi:MAG: hypothetical protein JSS81_14630 [Acidobacteria bacterium]|nr:hypothetical protein [Acidobacteriota bacterium]